jgi:F-type H+-transporting ATPase subunit b
MRIMIRMLLPAVLALALAPWAQAVDQDHPRTVAHEAVDAHASSAGHAVADEHASEAGHEQPGLLEVDIGSAFWTIVLFVVLLLVLGKFVWPPILQGLQNREQKIADDLRHAQTAANEATQTLKKYQEQLAEAQAEAGRMIEQGRADAQRIAAGLKDQTQSEIDQMKQRAEADIQAATQRALGDIHAQAATLATAVAGRILEREIRGDEHQELIKRSLAALDVREN